MKEVVLKKVLEIEEFGNKFYDLCEELYEMWTGLDVIERYIEMEFWKDQISDFIEDIKGDGDYSSKDGWIVKVEEVLKEFNKLDGELCIKF